MEQDKKTLIDGIKLPQDLRQLKPEELPQLCAELRQTIIQEVSVNPGHFASSLGVVELTVALHYVFDTPHDRIVWDVGHQAYGHKILTGRKAAFHSNRKLNGIAPFPTPKESEYDTFACGHAANSISAALGMAVATKRLDEKPRNIISVIGDGSMSCGLAFEGINNVSSIPNDMLIILNDNDMSIDRAVGGMEKYLLGLNTNETYNNLRYKISQWLKSIGLLTDKRRKGIIRLNNAIKSALSRQQNIFEGMNIRYFGPHDGHDVVALVEHLRLLKRMRGPKLLHLHTVKGKGYKPAEEAATIWHAPGVFDPETGQRLESDDANAAPRYQDVFGETLLELAQENPKIIGVTPAMPTGCSLNILMSKMPDRAFDVGIAEGHAVTFAAGMAKDGLTPFCNIYSSFAQRAYDNIIHDVALLKLPVIMCLDRAGLVGEDGATHHGAFDLAYLRAIPHMTIASPMDEHYLRHLMFTAQKDPDGPFVIRYPRGKGIHKDWQCPMQEVKIGKGRCVTQGEDIAILSIGPIGNDVREVIREIGEEKSIAHYDMIFLKPIDEEILREVVQKHKTIITIEDGVKNGGLGSAVTEWCNDHGFDTRVIRMGLPDDFIEHGTIGQLKEIAGIDKHSIKKQLLQ